MNRNFRWWCQSLALTTSIVIFVSSLTGSAQEPDAPLTKDELINMFQKPVFRNNPERVLNEFVRRNKLSFLPTKQVVDQLNRSGVPKMITDELKKNFASRIVYRVCQFEPVRGDGDQFTQLLITQLGGIKFLLRGNPEDLLFDKTFEPVPAGPTGPTREELNNHPHTGYVLIMGNVETDRRNRHNKTVTANLVFVSRVQERMIIAPPLVKTIGATRASQENIAKEIAEWSIKEVEKQIR